MRADLNGPDLTDEDEREEEAALKRRRLECKRFPPQRRLKDVKLL